MLKLSQKTGKNDILIPDASANLIWAMQAFYLKGQRVFTALNHSPMGYSMPATIGAYMADKKNKNIICTIGDGSMQMNIQELATISYLKIPAKIFVLKQRLRIDKTNTRYVVEFKEVGVDSKSDLAMPDLMYQKHMDWTVEINNHNDLDYKIDHVLVLKNQLFVILIS